MAPKTIIIFII